MDPTSLYETYTNAVADGKLEVLKMFVDTLMAHPFQAAFFLLLASFQKAVKDL